MARRSAARRRAGGGGGSGSASGSGGSASRAGSRSASARHTAAGGARTRDVGRAAMQLVRVVGDDREPRARLGQAARRVAGLTEGRGRRRRAPCRRGRAARAARRGPPERTAQVGSGDPAGSLPARRTPPGRPGATSRSASSTSAAHVAGSSAPAPTTSAGDSASARKAARASTVCGSRFRRARSTGAGRGGGLALLVGGLAQSSIGTITSAGPAPASRPRGRRARSRPGRPGRRPAVSTDTGYVARQPGQLPGEERLVGEVPRGPAGRRATTSGARFTRAVARR